MLKSTKVEVIFEKYVCNPNLGESAKLAFVNNFKNNIKAFTSALQ